MRIDLHNHTTLCNHATGTMDEYIQKAIEKNIDIFGFSCHAPMKYEPEYRMSLPESKIYEQDIIDIKEKYKQDIKVLAAYEVDFMSNPDFIEKDIINSNVDYLIGSVHFLDNKETIWGFDNPAFIKTYEHQNIDKIWQDYFDAITSMVKTGYFDIVGHLDLIKVFKFLPKKDIRLIAKETMYQIKKSNMVMELNAAGLRKPISESYPSKLLLQLAYELDIPITFGSDAHAIEQIGFGYDAIVEFAKEIGYKKCISFEKKDKIIHKI